MSHTIADEFLKREENTLSKYAFLTKNTKGRVTPVTPCPNRTEFQRDRDRILHSKAFRRLTNKTQVFLCPMDEHYRTRMTHTLEVTQIARIIARALCLNEDLTEAIALGHDLGHTPFGHAGEAAMRKCFDKDFSHSEQSVRVVEKIENDGRGLNLTYEVKNGILMHTGDAMAETLEGVIVKFADRIAYINHDIDDACRAGILTTEQIPAELLDILGRGHSERINCLVSDLIANSRETGEIKMSESVGGAMMKLRDFLYKKVYTNTVAKAEDNKAQRLIKMLFDYYSEHIEALPELYLGIAKEDGEKRAVCDYISGMTDRYAIDQFRELFVPSVWKGRNID